MRSGLVHATFVIMYKSVFTVLAVLCCVCFDGFCGLPSDNLKSVSDEQVTDDDWPSNIESSANFANARRQIFGLPNLFGMCIQIIFLTVKGRAMQFCYFM